MWEDIDGGGCFIVIYVFSKGLLIGEIIFFWVIKLFFLYKLWILGFDVLWGWKF